MARESCWTYCGARTPHRSRSTLSRSTLFLGQRQKGIDSRGRLCMAGGLGHHSYRSKSGHELPSSVVTHLCQSRWSSCCGNKNLERWVFSTRLRNVISEQQVLPTNQPSLLLHRSDRQDNSPLWIIDRTLYVIKSYKMIGGGIRVDTSSLMI